MVRVIFTGFAKILILSSSICAGALAAETNKAKKSDREVPGREFSSGIFATRHSWFAYTSNVLAPAGGLDRSGLRLRFMAGYGQYDYDSQRAVAGSLVATEFDGNVTLSEIMAGYAWDFGALWLKTYIGLAYADHRLRPDDPGNDIKGARFGVKGQIESWLRMTPQSWFSADASFSSPFSDYWLQVRLGRDVGSILSAGPEASLSGNREYGAGRAGGFLRFQAGKSQLTFSGGLSGNFRESDSYYAAAEAYRRF